VYDESLKRQTYLVRLSASALSSALKSQETVLNLLGEELVRTYTNSDIVNTPGIFHDILSLDKSLSALGFTDPEGNFLHISKNADLSILPNLKQQKESRDSFIHALENNDRMVLGRTYYFKPIKEMAIPIRKAVKDKDGKILAVSTAALRLSAITTFFSEDLKLGETDRVGIIRDFDRYYQFVSYKGGKGTEWTRKPVPDYVFIRAEKKLKAKYGKGLVRFKTSEDVGAVSIKDFENSDMLIVFKFIKRYELWVISTVTHKEILVGFYKKFSVYLSLYVLVSVLFFFLFRIISENEKKKTKELEYQATHDTLTNLPNRNYLLNYIDTWISRDSSAFSVMYVDMDNFKNLNDSYGHQAGDQVLKIISRRLLNFIGKDEIVIRHGGDEFIIFIKNTDNDILLEKACSLISILSDKYVFGGFSFVLGASIGISKYPEHGDNLDSLLKAADIAMYESKKHKNTSYLFDSSMEKSYVYRIEVESELRNALKNNELYMVYQPQLDQSGNMYAVEALIRWENEKLGFVNPQTFISVAEDSGQMPAIGDFVTETSLMEIKEVFERTGINFILSINVSIKQFVQKEFLNGLQGFIRKSGMNESMIKLEITENLFIEDIDYIVPILNRIKDMGIRISLDDFGTGYSSLSVLRLLPIVELKIDKSFVDDILTDVSSQKMVKNIIDIGVNQNMCVVAEGVESLEQKDALIEYGCERFQGYLFSKPLKKDDLIAYIEKCKNDYINVKK